MQMIDLKVILVGVRGFEPPASASRTQRSTRLSHTPMPMIITAENMVLINGASLSDTPSGNKFFRLPGLLPQACFVLLC
jgi:hypothetical protein